jgi:dipeptidyl aminopeptidase/acylaminoacyl peptidase
MVLGKMIKYGGLAFVAHEGLKVYGGQQQQEDKHRGQQHDHYQQQSYQRSPYGQVHYQQSQHQHEPYQQLSRGQGQDRQMPVVLEPQQQQHFAKPQVKHWVDDVGYSHQPWCNGQCAEACNNPPAYHQAQQ